MAQIGLAIAGRHPGFLVFTQINWPGPAPEDKDVHAMCSGDSYISAILGPEWDTYELAMCNFVSNSGRTEALRILLRVPHGYCFLNSQNQPVSPSYILHEAGRMLNGTPLVHLGSTLRFAPGVIRPVFPEENLSAMLGQFHIQPRWGGEITMRHASGHPQYIIAGEQDIPTLLAALPHCTRLEDSSTVYFGPFKDTAQPRFVYYPEELAARFNVLVNVKQRNGAFVPRTMEGGAITFDTRELGYPAQAYESIQYTLTGAQVEAAYRSGDCKVDTPPFVEVVLRPETGDVVVSFSPTPIRKIFTVVCVDSDNRPLPLPDLMTTLESSTPIPVNPTGYPCIGEDIVSFESTYHDANALAAKFILPPTSVYNITDAKLTGNVITVKVRRKAPPIPVKPPVHGPKNEVTAAASTKTLTVIVSANEMPLNKTLTVQSISDNGSSEFFTVAAPNFTSSADGLTLNASLEVPADLNTQYATATLGMPPEREAKINHTPDGNFMADFGQSKKKGFFSRISDLFAYRYETFVPGSWKIWRSLLPALVGFVLMIAGIIIGAVFAEELNRVFDKGAKILGLRSAATETTTTAAPTDSIVAEAVAPGASDEIIKEIEEPAPAAEETTIDK